MKNHLSYMFNNKNRVLKLQKYFYEAHIRLCERRNVDTIQNSMSSRSAQGILNSKVIDYEF